MSEADKARVLAKDKAIFQNSLIASAGKMGKLTYSFDWSATTLGPLSKWPQSLKTILATVLGLAYPTALLWGPDGIMLYNDAYAVFAGNKHPRILGQKISTAWPDSADFNRSIMRRCLNGETISLTNQRLTMYRKHTPEEVWMDLSYSPVSNEQGTPIAVLAIIVDTTQVVLAKQKQELAEKELKSERKRLYSLFMQAPALIASLRGPDHVFDLANPPYLQLVGNRPIIGKPIRDALPELKGQGIYEILDDVYKTGKPYFGNELLVHLDRTGKGRTRPCYFNFVYQPFFNVRNKVDGILIHAVDVTTQVKARTEAEDSEKHFRFMAETLPLKIFTANAHGKITYFNPQWSEYTGIPMKLLRQNGVQQLLHPDDLEPSMHEWRSALKTGEPVQNEQRLLRYDGQYRRHISYARAMRDDKGKILSWFGSMTDIEDILITAVRRDKLELMTAGLKQQRAQLLAITKVKDEFIALASHQLRTPATAVKQYISLVLSGFFGPITEEQAKHLQTAYDSNEHELTIINDLLKTAQIDSKMYTLKKRDENIASIVREVISELESALELKKQNIILEGKYKNAKAYVDKDEIKLVITNLLENASKYSHFGKEIAVSINQKGDYLELIISDQGVGISRENIKHIFEKFTRISNELSDTVSGSGLGLYWVKRIVLLHKGTINVRSTPGRGSVFTVKLPL